MGWHVPLLWSSLYAQHGDSLSHKNQHFWVLGAPLWKDDGMGAGSPHFTTEGRYLILVLEGLPLTMLVEG